MGKLIAWIQFKLQALSLHKEQELLAGVAVPFRQRPPAYQAVYSWRLGEWVTISGELPGCLGLPPVPTADGTIAFYERPSDRPLREAPR